MSTRASAATGCQARSSVFMRPDDFVTVLYCNEVFFTSHLHTFILPAGRHSQDNTGSPLPWPWLATA